MKITSNTPVVTPNFQTTAQADTAAPTNAFGSDTFTAASNSQASTASSSSSSSSSSTQQKDEDGDVEFACQMMQMRMDAINKQRKADEDYNNNH